MPIFDAAVEAAVAGRSIAAVPLVLFDFQADPHYLWPGHGVLDAGGQTWTGLGDLGNIDGVNAALTDAAQAVTFTLSGVTPAIQALALAAESRVRGRAVIVYVQFFDVATMQALGGSLSIWSGVMDVMTFTASGASARTITLTAESDNADRRRPRFGLLTDADQQARYPGDTGLRFRPTMRFKTLRQPW